MKRKTNPELVETIELAKKHNLLDLGKKLSGSTRKQAKVNLEDLSKQEGHKFLVIGGVLGKGEISKKIEISALGFSESAKEKLKKKGCEIKTIKQEIKHNHELKGVKVLN